MHSHVGTGKGPGMHNQQRLFMIVQSIDTEFFFPGRNMKQILAIVCAGLVATVVGYFGAIQYGTFFTLPEELADTGSNVSAEVLQKVEAASSAAKEKNLALVASIYGAGLCLLSAIVAGLVARGRPLLGGIVGLLAGTVAGAAGGMSDMRIYSALRAAETSTFLSTITAHASLWCMIALAFGIAVSVATRGQQAVQLGGVSILMGCIAAVLFPIVAAVVFPTANSELPRPAEAHLNWVWFGMPSILLGLGAGRIISSRQAGTESTPQAKSAAT